MSYTDKDTLHLLAIFHYILAGLIALLFCLPLIHLVAGITLTVGGFAEDVPALGIMGAALTIVVGLVILVGWGLAVLVFLAGKNLDRQTKYQLCLAGAGVLCIFVPLGTILGVFTLVTLQDDSVKKMFDGNKKDGSVQLPADSGVPESGREES